MLDLKNYEEEKAKLLSEKLSDVKLSVEDKKVILLKDIADSLSIIAGKLGRRLL